MLIDLQVHSTFGSPDSSITPEQLARACRLQGLGGVAVTEHRPTPFSDLARIAETEGMILLAGREVAIGPHHVLVFSADHEALNSLQLAESPATLDREEFACVWAHPAHPGGASVYPPFLPPSDDVAGILHAVEVLNGKRLHLADGIRAARQASRAMELPGVGGSDAHVIDEVGKCVTSISEEAKDAVTIVDAIRAGKVSPLLSKVWAQTNGYTYRDDLSEFVG